ncbi:preprotein translocase subunit SecE [Luedemannella helvata]|uniref:Protein translocase subunit SecE n=1 Tax=Luedemannella helvata TaxID=349315 RepID=A0ABN2K2B4_9ACTN
MADSKRRGDDPEAEGAGGSDAELEELLEESEDETPERAEKAERKSAVESFERRSTKPGEKGPGLFGRFTRFVREVVAELRKVIWPTRKELLTYTSVVIVFVVIMLSIVGLLDLGFAKVLLAIFGA